MQRLDEKMSKVVAAITAPNRLFAILSDTHMTQREIDDLQIHLRNTHGRFSAERDMSSRHELSGWTGWGRLRMTFA